ncbi:hypothetical protein GM418_10795 [Maribellus comscasis]|uniref:Uncharacterized protein n=1 Tax=Maribellus comscasis TaxID=2681766 RepID=A0A6I6JVM8_9BACT|nr:hypothetical protein [Maribellus comscasis]QGY44127.1 hypothetical protein GM418_10795 [Maribellus comscasis]
MKTANLEQIKVSSCINGGNPPFELEIYIRVKIFIIGLTGSQLANKKELEENIINQLSKNLQLTHHDFSFSVENKNEPYQISIDVSCIFIIPKLQRNVFSEANDLVYKVLKSFQANAVSIK